MPPPNDKGDTLRKQLDDAMRRKRAMQAAEQQRSDQRAREGEQREKLRSKDVAGEEGAKRERTAAQTLWRKGKHAQRRAEEEARIAGVKEAQRLAAERKKAEEERKKRERYMEDLHRTAVRRRTKAKQESALHEEDDAKRRAADLAQRSLKEIGQTEQNASAHLEAECKRHLAAATADRDRIVLRAEEEARRAKRAKGADIALVERERRAAVDAAHDAWKVATARIEGEFRSLQRETKGRADAKRSRTETEARNRASSATRKRKAEEEWLGIEEEG